MEVFEEKSLQNIETYCRFLSLAGYEKWVSLCLIKILDADKNFQVYVRHIERAEHALVESAATEEEVAQPQESNYISFDHTGEDLLAVVDFIIHSKNIDKYISFRSKVDRAIATATNASNKREWYPNYSAITFGYGLTLLYVANIPREISLVADAKRFCRPDLVIESRVQKGWHENGGLEEIKFHHSILRPRLGTYVVSKEIVPKQVYDKFISPEEEVAEGEIKATTSMHIPEFVSEKNGIEDISEKPSKEKYQHNTAQQNINKEGERIRVLSVGYDQNKLETIISSLKIYRNEAA